MTRDEWRDFINFDGRGALVNRCWHILPDLTYCAVPHANGTIRVCDEHSKTLRSDLEEQDRRRDLRHKRGLTEGARAGFTKREKWMPKFKRHSWEPTKFAESTETGETFPVGWTCRGCGLFKRMGVMNRVHYKDRSHAGECRPEVE